MEKVLLEIIQYLLDNKKIKNYHFFQNGRSVQVRLCDEKVFTLMSVRLYDLRFDHTKSKSPRKNRLS